MSLDHKAHVEHASPVEPSVVESKTPWFKTLTGKIAVGAAALVTAAGIGVGVGASVNNGEGRQEPSAAAPQDPSPEVSPTETVTTPEATETAEPQPELPFDRAEVDLLKGKEITEFETYPETARIQYWLESQHVELFGNDSTPGGDYGYETSQELNNGLKLYNYNPFDKYTLDTASDKQDILNAYVYGWVFAKAHAKNNPVEAAKFVSGYVANPESELYQDEVAYATEPMKGDRMPDKEVNDPDYRASGEERYEEDGVTYRKIYVEDNYEYTSSLYPYPA